MDLNKKNNSKKELDYIDHNKLVRFREKRKKIIGIYFLFYKDELIYIGQSIDIEKRLMDHRKDKVFDKYSYKRIHYKDLDKIEKACILHYGPKLNTIHNKKVASIVEINAENNKAKFTAGKMIINIFGRVMASEISFLKNKKTGYFEYEFKDIKGEFIKTNGSAIIKNFPFYVKYMTKTHIFQPIGNYEWQLVETL